MLNIIYFHICCINNWREVYYKLLNHIKVSKLYDEIHEIRCVVLGEDYNNEDFADAKIKIIFKSTDINLKEVKIMELMYENSLNEDVNMLYIHTKGVSCKYIYDYKSKKCISDWIEYMTYFNIYKWKICLEKIKEYDVVGVNLIDYAPPVGSGLTAPLHYSGTFWWSKSSHVRNTGLIKDRGYYGPEFYITSNPNGKYACLWNSHLYHYVDEYPSYLYMDK
jgi:hypothetical protein